jgi:hypothetical protein
MTTYRVEVDGDTVWTHETPEYEGAKTFPAEYLARPVDTPDGVPHPSPAHLFVDDVLIGVQRSHGDEADVLDAAAGEGSSDPVVAAQLRALAADARAKAAVVVAAQALVDGAAQLTSRIEAGEFDNELEG